MIDKYSRYVMLYCKEKKSEGRINWNEREREPWDKQQVALGSLKQKLFFIQTYTKQD